MSELLRRYRGRAGLTQAALAAKAGLSDQAISVLERGTRTRPRIDTVRALVKVLGLDKSEAEHFLAVARGKVQAAEEPEAAVEALPMPWQLPPAVSDFTGRTAQIEAILDVLRVTEGTAGTSVRLVAVTGMGGIGKTTLAVQAAHRLVDSYPDGHLYLNLRGYGPGKPVSTAEALRQLLRSLGTEPNLIPDDVEEASGLLRSQLTGRRVLLFLDNTADVSHVLPLLPGNPSSAAIITSRESLATLPGARQVRLDALSESESVDLLAGVIGKGRVAAEPAAAEALTRMTGRLPLAVRLIGGRLAARPSWPIQHLVDLLRDEESRLDSLGADDTGVRANIASSVNFLRSSDRAVDREAADILPLLGVLDGPDLLTSVAARLVELPDRHTHAALERLVDLNLLESIGPERYRFHDLIRAYARELADQEFDAADRDAALERVIRFYIGCAWQSQRLSHPTSPRLALGSVDPVVIRPLKDRSSALRWFDAELRNVMDRFAQAQGSSLSGSPLLPELALALFGYYETRHRWPEMQEMTRGAVELARRRGRLAMAAWLKHDQAIPEVENLALDAALPYLLEALTMFREVDDLPGQSRCCSSLTYVLASLGRLDEALDFGRQSLQLAQKLGDGTLEGVAYVAVAVLYDRTGDYDQADEDFDRGIQLARHMNDRRSEYKRQFNAGRSNLLVGRYDAARKRLIAALDVAKALDDHVILMEIHQALALVHSAEGDYRAAQESAEIALALSRRSKDTLREGRVLLELARIHAAAGESETAIALSTQAISLLTGRLPIHLRLAEELQAQLRRGEPYTYAVETLTM